MFSTVTSFSPFFIKYIRKVQEEKMNRIVNGYMTKTRSLDSLTQIAKIAKTDTISNDANILLFFPTILERPCFMNSGVPITPNKTLVVTYGKKTNFNGYITTKKRIERIIVLNIDLPHIMYTLII